VLQKHVAMTVGRNEEVTLKKEDR